MSSMPYSADHGLLRPIVVTLFISLIGARATMGFPAVGFKASTL
jgi:hypothetical protein